MVEHHPNGSAVKLIEQLGSLLNTESHSLSRHLDSAKPYVSPATYHTWEQIREMLHTSHGHEQKLTELLVQLGGPPPQPGTFQSGVAYYHDLDIATLIKQLVEEKSRQTAAYQRAVKQAQPYPAIAGELQALLDEVRSQRKLLGDLEIVAVPS